MSINANDILYGLNTKGIFLKYGWLPSSGQYPLASEGWVYIAEDSGTVNSILYGVGDSIIYKDGSWIRFGRAVSDALDSTAPEPITGIWDFQNGVTISDTLYGQDITLTGLGTINAYRQVAEWNEPVTYLSFATSDLNNPSIYELLSVDLTGASNNTIYRKFNGVMDIENNSAQSQNYNIIEKNVSGDLSSTNDTIAFVDGSGTAFSQLNAATNGDLTASFGASNSLNGASILANIDSNGDRRVSLEVQTEDMAGGTTDNYIATKKYVDDNAGSGLDRTVAEPITGVWDFQNGLDADTVGVGLDVTIPGLGITPSKYSYTVDFNGNSTVTAAHVVINDGSNPIQDYNYALLDTASMLNSDTYYRNYGSLDTLTSVTAVHSTYITKSAIGMACSSGITSDNGTGQANIQAAVADDDTSRITLSADTIEINGTPLDLLDRAVAEPITGIWDFQNGVTANGIQFGQEVTLGVLGTFPSTYVYSWDNSGATGTIDVENYEVVVSETASSLNIYSGRHTTYADWDIGDSFAISEIDLINWGADPVGFTNFSTTKTASGFDTTKQFAVKDDSDEAYVLIEVANNIPKVSTKGEGDEVPIDGRILVEEVTASRSLTKADIGKILIVTGSSDVTITVPTGLQDKGFNCSIQNKTTSNVVSIDDDGAGGTTRLENLYNEFNVILNGTASILPTLVTDYYTVLGDVE